MIFGRTIRLDRASERPCLRRRRRISSSCALVFALAAAVWIGCGKKTETPVSSGARVRDAEIPSQEGWKSSIILTRAGKRQAVIRYGHMAEYESSQTAVFDQGVQVDFYDVQGKHSSRLTSERGRYDENSEDIAAEGRVVVVSDTGVTLKTERLNWSHRTEKIVTEDLVTITTREGDTLHGFGFESTADLSRWVIKQPRGLAKKGVNLNEIESSFKKTPDSVRAGEK